MAVSWAIGSCPPLALSACVQPLPAAALCSGGPPSLMSHPSLLDIDPVQPNPSPRLCLLSSSPPLFLLLPRLSTFSSPAALDTSLCSHAQCPHQHSVLKLLGLRLQLHAMLLEHSSLAQASPDAVCRWTGACSELPFPGPPHLPGAFQGQGHIEEERKRETKDRDTDLSFLGDFSLSIRKGMWRKLWFLMFLSQGTVAE